MEALHNDDQYQDIMSRLQDPDQENEWTTNDKVYRIKRRLLKIHERNQLEHYSY